MTEHIFILSAGHGPATPGKRSPDGSLREFHFNHPTTQFLAAELLTYQNVKVEFCYNANTDTPLQTRTDFANKIYDQHRDAIRAGRVKVVYISVHANAFGSGGWNDVQGIETFVHPSRPAEAVRLADNVQRQLIADTGRKNRGRKTADFHELRATKMTAILAECEFMTNRESLALLKSTSYRQTCARAIAKGAANTFGLKKKPTPAKAIQSATTAGGVYRVQAGAFKDKNGATARANAIRAKGIEAALVYENGLYKVQAGAFREKAGAERRAAQVVAAGFEAALIFIKV